MEQFGELRSFCKDRGMTDYESFFEGNEMKQCIAELCMNMYNHGYYAVNRPYIFGGTYFVNDKGEKHALKDMYWFEEKDGERYFVVDYPFDE